MFHAYERSSPAGDQSVESFREELTAIDPHTAGGMEKQRPSPPPSNHMSAAPPAVAAAQSRPKSLLRPRTMAALDYSRIKNDLTRGSPMTQAAVLQALRWRLVKSPPGRLRRRTLATYIQSDLLGCASDQSLIPSLAQSPESVVSEQWARLVNCAASECAGRTYLLRQDGLVLLLCSILQSEKSDNPLRRNTLGALQKFSLRSKPQNDMIDAGLIEWIVTELQDIDNLSDYSIEYGTALLMNLSLRTAGKLHAENVPILQVVNSLLEIDNMQVRTYVNGTLYSVLTRPVLKENARAMGMEEILKSAMEHADETFARQIQYILEQLISDERDDALSDDNEEDEDEEEEEEDDEAYEEDAAEEDDPEDWIDGAEGNHALGEELLCGTYLATTGGALEEDDRIRSSQQLTAPRQRRKKVAEQAQETPLQRPVTPGDTTVPEPESPVSSSRIRSTLCSHAANRTDAIRCLQSDVGPDGLVIPTGELKPPDEKTLQKIKDMNKDNSEFVEPT
jgi:hypothetical protein